MELRTIFPEKNTKLNSTVEIIEVLQSLSETKKLL